MNILSIKRELKKFFLKIFNKPQYYEYRAALRLEKKQAEVNYDFLKEIEEISFKIDNKEDLYFKHSGHLGDLIYALPLIKKLSQTHKCYLYINIDEEFSGYYHKHPAGRLMINENIYKKAYPLLESQDYLKSVSIYKGQPIDIDLDLFRKLPGSNSFHSSRWYFQVTGVQSNLAKPFIEVEPHPTIKDKIIVVKTERAMNPYITYDFMKDYDDILFLGTEAEYELFVKKVPKASFYNVKDFLELAQIIKACKFYVSNQTMAYAIAEGLKVDRILEAYPDFPVVFPIGGKGKDVYFQNHFEKTFKSYLE